VISHGTLFVKNIIVVVITDFVNQAILPPIMFKAASKGVVSQLTPPDNNDVCAFFLGYIAPCLSAPWYEEVLYHGYLLHFWLSVLLIIGWWYTIGYSVDSATQKTQNSNRSHFHFLPCQPTKQWCSSISSMLLSERCCCKHNNQQVTPLPLLSEWPQTPFSTPPQPHTKWHKLP